MIRPSIAQEIPDILRVAQDTGLFQPDQLTQLCEMLENTISDSTENGPFWLTDEDSGVVGLVYCEPERMTEGTWNLQLIAIHPTRQRQGRGAALLRGVEAALKSRSARILLVDTSGTSSFEGVRHFYQRNGYEEEARIRDFYQPGDDKVTFRKAL